MDAIPTVWLVRMLGLWWNNSNVYDTVRKDITKNGNVGPHNHNPLLVNKTVVKKNITYYITCTLILTIYHHLKFTSRSKTMLGWNDLTKFFIYVLYYKWLLKKYIIMCGWSSVYLSILFSGHVVWGVCHWFTWTGKLLLQCMSVVYMSFQHCQLFGSSHIYVYTLPEKLQLMMSWHCSLKPVQGVDISSLWIRGGIRTISGTSMAAPHVAGVMAKYLSDMPSSTTPDELKSHVLRTWVYATVKLYFNKVFYAQPCIWLFNIELARFNLKNGKTHYTCV